MKPRRLKLSSGIWRYLVGKTCVTLWSPSGKKLVFSTPYWEPHERSVTPGLLRRFIEERVLLHDGPMSDVWPSDLRAVT